ncbi:MAG TPA: DUF6285 domain-containing protein [Vicinamibacteria bacterium]|nr:DUF6285 domain-containing protein [Vicinamibacteria bacterium]
MTEEKDPKARLTDAIRERLETELIPKLQNSKVRSRTVVGMNVLAIAEKQIGKGQPANPEEWERLRHFVKDQPEVLKMVDTFEEAVAKVEAEIAVKVKDSEADEGKLRKGMMEIIRAVVLKKIAEASKAEPGEAEPGPAVESPKPTEG